MTNSYFTDQEKKLADACDVNLMDWVNLQKFIKEVNPVFKALEIFENITPEFRKCSKYGQDLALRDRIVPVFSDILFSIVSSHGKD